MVSLLGKYILLMAQVFRKPAKWRVFWDQLMSEFQKIGVESMGIVAIISLFMGAVLTMQVAFNIDSPLVSPIIIGFTVRQSVILEFAPTVISLILAGKVGSRIASEIGTMRVTEQIDALQTMGVNSANYLIFPKMIAAILFNPVLIVMSMFLGLIGGLVACLLLDLTSFTVYVDGLQAWYEPWSVSYALIKTVIFAFIIVSVSGFNGYIIKGGALEVGNASTKAVVQSSILIILFNLLLTEILL
ncbi:MAG TPA: ABC transporter permease [Bacteroidales bacterium]|nr:ABC transporter permease [Bacteroidales bacterium]HOX77213.1 ABC transporter permease [Bacteroidales bacterium]HPI84870.1 ABC transporter permease [Bacteroidales bacterium]HPM92531.1 ABC transporter permease [Bacteroidales bacterium]